jgi:hypothetical protein
LALTGPAVLPAAIPNGLGVVQHSFANSFTAIIPKAWVKSGLTVAVTADTQRAEYNNLKIGAPTKLIMNMFDVQYFADTSGDYPAGWQQEIAAKWPIAEYEVRRLGHVVFPELVIPPRAGVPAARVKSKADYTAQTGLAFDGEQAAALEWKSALKAAAGKSGRISYYYINIYGANAGGAGWRLRRGWQRNEPGHLPSRVGSRPLTSALGRQHELSLQGRHVWHRGPGDLQRHPCRPDLGLRSAHPGLHSLHRAKQ